MKRAKYYQHIVTVLLCTALLQQSCKDVDKNRIAIPVCTCVVRGTTWTIDPRPDKGVPLPPGEDNYFIHDGNTTLTNHVTDLVYAANDNVWIPGADIAIVEALGGDGNIPVINDPGVTTGRFGEISVQGPVTEGSQAATLCRQAYGEPLGSDKLVIIIARKLVYNDGSSTNEAGYAEDYADVLKRNNGMDLCSFPGSVVKDDVKGRYIVLEDPALYGDNGEKGHGIPYIILGHELGHVLTLGHGNGLDDDNNGTPPPGNGPRLFDQYCDPAEYRNYDLQSDTRSLMSPVAGYYKNITPLQKEEARRVAPLMPGAVGPG